VAVRNIWRLSMVFAVGMAAFFVAINQLNNPPFSACQNIPPPNEKYLANIVQDPSVNLTSYDVEITTSGRPVAKAKVCLSADMGGAGGMSGMGLNQVASEVRPGVYHLPLRFPMGGPWRGSVVVAPKNSTAVGVPIQFNVKAQ